ncbi:hypothetical protein PPMP20_31935 [Paraburkholderia phymatum]|uniref:Uncharacterized protein n=1 Tax=Paraburkholderia phymatum (strain DSM 17167 / CIP 108236 / LMG 21445 / STM815) TaxID=391038 RepID=B2JH38_PARP8|nr:hypothetical protein [Paraburkholderia phymatum]ACC70276.1 hypothetical protein Bphy_1087 [Paraburkholderia phymatum STM815]
MILRFFAMAKRHSLLVVASLALLLSTSANAAFHHTPQAGLPDSGASAMASPTSRGSSLDDALSQNGIVPGSGKARMLTAWFDMILRDPVIATRFPGGARSLQEVFFDEGKREALMSSGLARLTPNERLDYLQLFIRLLDELVPVNCFGLVDMRSVMNRITLAQMSDADAALYLRLIYRVLVSSGSDIPVRLPTQEEYEAAVEALSRAIVIELDADPASMDRYELYMVHPSEATPSDVCWTTRVTLHAVAKMSETQRDFVLLPAISGSESFKDRAAEQPAESPLPFRNRATEKAIH